MPGDRRSKAIHVGTGGPNGRRVAAERGVIGTEEEDIASVDQRRAGVSLQPRPLLGVDVPHQRRIRRRRVRAAGDPDASVGTAVGVADAEALHDGEGPAAQAQEMPCGGQADHPTADNDGPIGSIAHVVGPFGVAGVAAWPSRGLDDAADADQNPSGASMPPMRQWPSAIRAVNGPRFALVLLWTAVAFVAAVPSAMAQEADLAVTKAGPATAAANSDVTYSRHRLQRRARRCRRRDGHRSHSRGDDVRLRVIDQRASVARTGPASAGPDSDVVFTLTVVIRRSPAARRRSAPAERSVAR